MSDKDSQMTVFCFECNYKNFRENFSMAKYKRRSVEKAIIMALRDLGGSASRKKSVVL